MFFLCQKREKEFFKMNLEDLTATTGDYGDFLGNLMWYSIGEQLVSVDDLEQKLTDADMDTGWMPNAIRSSDAFRRATKEVEKKQPRIQSGENINENILIREVDSNQKMVQRNIVVETVDQQGKRLHYSPDSAVITLDKKNSTVCYESKENEEVLNPLCQSIQDKFNIYKSHYSAQQLRAMVKKILDSLAPTPVKKNGGIYFIPATRQDDLKKLITLIGTLENSEGYKVPVINTSDNRSMVSNKLYDHFNSLLNNCKNKPNMKKGDMKALINEANRAIKDYRDYKEIVSEDIDSINDVVRQVRSEIMDIAADINE